ncbi:calcium/proton exchanger [Terrihabitans soli]|uniref:Ca(2+)/H(+) antiporter n=1 Tax=Terrihabitans soli TaxID=708113 RepID=A0A6S6QZ57_9HYPH|nr:calcium/proton exchanger [Terrihabitans soli]BCJ91908.1 calcium/proton exchanger [Terrihabitans soli]
MARTRSPNRKKSKAANAGSSVFQDIARNPLLWLLAAVPAVLWIGHARPDQSTLLFILSALAIVPLAALLSRATESIAHRTGDAIGGLLNATLGNLTELIIALTALKAGEYMLVKASIVGAIVSNTLFMLGSSFLLGGLKYHTQEFNRSTARLQAGMLFLASVALVVPSAFGAVQGEQITAKLSFLLAVLLILTYGCGLVFSLGTHRGYFGSAVSAGGHDEEEGLWPVGEAVAVLVIATLLIAFVAEVFVHSLEGAGAALGMGGAFIGFVVVAIVGAAGEIVAAWSGARKNKLDLSVGIALGSAVQIALFVAPVLVLLSFVIGPAPMTLEFWPGAIFMVFAASLVAALVSGSGRSAWFLGLLILSVYATFAITLYILPPQAH